MIISKMELLTRCYSGGSSSNSNSYSPQMTPDQMIQLYQQNLPSALGTTVAQAPGTATTLAQSAAAANPIYTQAGLSQLQSLAPGYQQAGSNLATQQAQSQLGLLTGTGSQMAGAATNLSNTLNPTQAAAQAQSANLLNSINLNGLSGGETAAVDRSLNQSNYATGNLGLDNATNAVSNAMQFGNALQAKRAELGSAIGTASGVAANQNSFANPVGTALGAGNTSTNFGLSTFSPTQANANITAPLTFGSSFGNQLAGLGAASQGGGSGGGAQGGLCCFIFLESYHGMLPAHVRTCRDKYYTHSPSIADGYKRMAKWLVPMMQKSVLVREFVWQTMVRPLSKYGEFVTRQNPEARRYRVFRKFWFTVWHLTSK